jgi:hypothetical protein
MTSIASPIHTMTRTQAREWVRDLPAENITYLTGLDATEMQVVLGCDPRTALRLKMALAGRQAQS